jgi:hypothetical protein
MSERSFYGPYRRDGARGVGFSVKPRTSSRIRWYLSLDEYVRAGNFRMSRSILLARLSREGNGENLLR